MTDVQERRLRSIAAELLNRADGLYRKLADPIPATDVLDASAPILSTCRTTSDQAELGTAFADITGLAFTLIENTHYGFDFTILADADATTTGIDVAITGPNSPTLVNYVQEYWTSATAKTERGANTYDNNTASATSNGTATRVYRVRGTIIVGASGGTLQARAKRENVGAGPNIRAGSFGLLWKLSA